MSTRNRLELTWVGKDQRPRLEPRILLEDPALSYHAPARRGDADQFDNLLIHGDNLLALKALDTEYAGRVKCICIDPPYNTGSAFTHYDDGLEHSLWLSMMRDRLEILRRLLREDGSIWITIDDREMPYLRILLDEVFGRSSFVAQNIWQKRYSRDNNSAIGDVHDYVICYAVNPEQFKTIRNRVNPDEKTKSAYRNATSDPKGPWRLIPMTGAGLRANQQYPVKTPSGRIIYPPEGRHWSVLEPKFLDLVAQGKVYFGKSGDSAPGLIRYFSEIEGLVPWTWWPHDEVGHTDESKKEIHALFGKDNAFDTPKPERLIHRIIHIATNPGDLVLDSFAGSGTTGAVAHKMGRRWIMVELGAHAKTHIVPRLRKVIDGTDPGGVTDACGWKGGGGFRFLRLAPSLMQKNAFGHWVISRDYNAEMLAEAVCKHLSFRYQPRPEFWWMMGQSTERDFICVTTASLTHEELRAISDEVGSERTLLICCKAFMARTDAFENLTVQKIPQTILHRCEWGRDDYSLSVASLPDASDSLPIGVTEPAPQFDAPSKTKSPPSPIGDLFDPATEPTP